MAQLQLFAEQRQHQDLLRHHPDKSPWDLLDVVNWDFTGESTQYLTHTFHSYPARFIPQIPGAFIHLFTREGDVVLDPFSGCGTTAVEAMLQKRKAIGVDANPLACLISKSKTTLIDADNSDRIRGLIRQFQRGEFSNGDSGDQNGDVEVKLPNRKISDIFTPDVVTELNMIKDTLQTLSDDPSLFNVSLVALSAAIRSLIESDRKEGESRSLSRSFSQKLKSMTASLDELRGCVDHSSVSILRGDARYLGVSSGSVDLVVTSPPYVNALDYYRVHQYNMAWLGMDYVAFRRQEIGGHSHFIANRFRLLSEYIGDMLRAMIEMSRVLKMGSVCVIVVGNSSLEFELIESYKFFSNMAADAGFTVRKTLFRNIDTTRKYNSVGVGKINNELLVVLEKTAVPLGNALDDTFIAKVVLREMTKFKAQVDENPGSYRNGKNVSDERINQNPARLAAAMSTIESDIRIK